MSDLNVYIIESNLSRSTLNLNSTAKRLVLIQNSSVGSIQTEPGFNVGILDSYIDGSERIHETFLKIENSNATMINSIFIENVADNKTIIVEGNKVIFQ